MNWRNGSWKSFLRNMVLDIMLSIWEDNLRGEQQLSIPSIIKRQWFRWFTLTLILKDQSIDEFIITLHWKEIRQIQYHEFWWKFPAPQLLWQNAKLMINIIRGLLAKIDTDHKFLSPDTICLFLLQHYHHHHDHRNHY